MTRDDEHVRLPEGYVLDLLSRSGLVVLRRTDGSFVAAYSSLSFRMDEARRDAEADARNRKLDE